MKLIRKVYGITSLSQPEPNADTLERFVHNMSSNENSSMMKTTTEESTANFGQRDTAVQEIANQDQLKKKKKINTKTKKDQQQ